MIAFILSLGTALALSSASNTTVAQPSVEGGQRNAAVAPASSLIQVNLGLAVATYDARGRWAAFSVLESAQGGIDLNGDGDALDQVLHVLDLETGRIKNTQISGTGVRVLEDAVTFDVVESWAGQDLNGDGDAIDRVAHVLHLATGELVNLRIARLSILTVEGPWCTFQVSEFFQGADLNGDGDMTDRHLHVYDARTDSVQNLGLPTRTGVSVVQDGPLLAFLVTEFAAGSQDLNGDGDEFDDVLFVHDFERDVTLNLGLAAEPSALEFNQRVSVDRGLVAMNVDESAQGSIDLNGDGDTADIVLHVFAASTGSVDNSGLSPIRTAPGQDPWPTFELAGGRVAFLLDEAAQGATDFDGNGLATEFVPHVYDPRTGQVSNAGVAAWIDPSTIVDSFIRFDGRFAAFMAPHATLGGTLQVYDASGGTLLDTQLPAGKLFGVGGGFVTHATRETLADLNGDGDQADVVNTVVEASTGAIQFTFASGTPMTLVPPRTYATAREAGEGVDLDGDGDLNDFVLYLHNMETGALVNTGLSQGDSHPVVAGRTLLITVDEAIQGVDLNGDGDTVDGRVLHRVALAP